MDSDPNRSLRQEEDGPKVFRFNKCPNCQSTDRLVGRMARSAKDKGMAREEWDPSLQNIPGVVVDPVRVSNMLLGQEVPTYMLRTDVCLRCGALYAIEVQIGTGRLQAPAPSGAGAVPGFSFPGGNGRPA